MSFGLRAKILVIALGTVAMTVAATLVTSNHLFDRAFSASLQSRSTAIAQSLSIQMDRILQLGIRIDSLVGFETRCKEVAETYDGIDFAMVVDLSGTVLFHSDASKHGETLDDAALLSAVQRETPAGAEYDQDGRRGVGAVVPIVTADGAHLGAVIVGLSSGYIDGHLREIQSRVLGVGLLCLALGGAALVIVLSTFISQPIANLTKSIERIRAGPLDFGARVKVRSKDELGSLADSFNALMQRLQDSTVSRESLQAAYAALLESESKYRELVSNANAIILRMDLAGRVIYFNEYAEKFFGFSRQDILGKTVIGTIFPSDDPDAEGHVQGIIRDTLAHPQAGTDTENVTRGGRSVSIRWANRVILDQSRLPIGILCVGHDITEKKLRDQELDRYRDHLEERVQERTLALSIAKEAAEAANRAKSTFLARMSHELRTPMNAVMGMTSIALRRATDSKQIDQLAKAMDASHRLLGIIDDVLDISNIEGERLSLASTAFTLRDVFASTVKLLEPKASQKRLQLLTEIPDELRDQALLGDPFRLGQILLNLAGNAIKFSDKGTITVAVGAEIVDPGELLLRFEVRDHGIGISPDDQKRLFNAFEQADDSTTRRFGGTGLGLAISKRLVQMMRGSIGVASQPGRGSVFWFTVRLVRADPYAADTAGQWTLPADQQLKANYPGLNVLLVDEEPINLEVARWLLEDVGFSVDLARNGSEAVALARSKDYGLILMDMQLPALNGMAATRAIRAMPGGDSIPILAMNESDFDDDHQTYIEAGIDDHVGKPVNPQQLYASILKWLARSLPMQNAGIEEGQSI